MEWLASYILKRQGIEKLPVLLHRKRIYILPSRFGVFFGLVLFIMLVGSLNYNNNLGLVLTFLLASLALVCTVHTARNLYDLELRQVRARPVFAGESADFHVTLRNPSKWPRPAIRLKIQNGAEATLDIPAASEQSWHLRATSRRRGWLRPGRLRVSSFYPLGLFESWAWVEPDARCLVYPAAEQSGPPPPPGREEGEGHFLQDEGEDFAGLRDYRPGDPSRRIAWKAVAHSDRLVTKEYLHTAGQTRWLDWDATAGLETDPRLSRLCRWILEAHARGDHYGLRLPGFTAHPALSEEHREHCLAALALFGE
jgi:uncharacterized protein (DUF58 family)